MYVGKTKLFPMNEILGDLPNDKSIIKALNCKYFCAEL